MDELRSVGSKFSLTSAASSSTTGSRPVPEHIRAELDVDKEEDCLILQRAVARSETLYIRPPLDPKQAIVNKLFKPLFKHPLPVSPARAEREETLRRIECVPIKKQAAGAVARRDAWVLEELYMRGTPVDHADSNGFTPLHIAVQLNDYECIMVLLNIGVNHNAATLLGFTPLYLSIATGSKQAEKLLLEKGAKMFIESTYTNAGFGMLDTNRAMTRRKQARLQPLSVNQKVDQFVGLPDRNLSY
jgi:hypothetical protein